MRYEDPNAPAVAYVAVLSAVALILVIISLQSLFYFASQREDERKALVVSPAELANLRAAQLAQLKGYRVVDSAKGVVTIPIERAMSEVVRESAAGR
jgi:uncharacterized BrkB/YihY/UPF0761 family membrane protein